MNNKLNNSIVKQSNKQGVNPNLLCKQLKKASVNKKLQDLRAKYLLPFKKNQQNVKQQRVESKPYYQMKTTAQTRNHSPREETPTRANITVLSKRNIREKQSKINQIIDLKFEISEIKIDPDLTNEDQFAINSFALYGKNSVDKICLFEDVHELDSFEVTVEESQSNMKAKKHKKVDGTGAALSYYSSNQESLKNV